MDILSTSEQTSDHRAELVTAKGLAERWGCSVGHLANLRSAGLGPSYIKIGSAVRYRVRDVLAYEQAHVVDTA